jgi:chitin disaccharide deacetylase
MKKLLFVLLTFAQLFAASGNPAATLLVRCDDIGMCHAVNEAALELAETGIPLNYSIMFVCPWYQEAVDMLKDHENICFGVHLTINSEWKNFRWGPCAVKGDVSSLVDEDGYFFPRMDLFYEADPSLEQIEIELRAQIERAVHSGLDVRYADTHMSSLDHRKDIRNIVIRLTKEYGLIYAYDVPDHLMTGIYSQPPEEKKQHLLKQLNNINRQGVNLLVSHLGKTGPEMDALIDMNPSGPANMSRHREAELHTLSSEDFRKSIEKNKIVLSTYAREHEKKGK